jgi:hypothetical protein
MVAKAMNITHARNYPSVSIFLFSCLLLSPFSAQLHQGRWWESICRLIHPIQRLVLHHHRFDESIKEKQWEQERPSHDDELPCLIDYILQMLSTPPHRGLSLERSQTGPVRCTRYHQEPIARLFDGDRLASKSDRQEPCVFAASPPSPLLGCCPAKRSPH